jgi:hypothetical protein
MVYAMLYCQPRDKLPPYPSILCLHSAKLTSLTFVSLLGHMMGDTIPTEM